MHLSTTFFFLALTITTAFPAFADDAANYAPAPPVGDTTGQEQAVEGAAKKSGMLKPKKKNMKMPAAPALGGNKKKGRDWVPAPVANKPK